MATPTTNQRDFAEGPDFTPLPHTLMDSAEVVPLTGHQKLGLMYQVETCADLTEYTQVQCSDLTGPAKEPNMDVLWRGADPFVVYSWLPCTYIGGEPPEKLKADTLAAHENNVARKIGSIFWNGGEDPDTQFQHLAADAAVTEVSGGSTVVLQTAASLVSGGALLDVVTAVGQIEQAIGECYGGVPFLHVPRSLIAEMAAEHLLDENLDSRGRLRTRSGSIVVAYENPPVGPDGTLPARPGTVWIYATSPVKVWRGALRWLARDAKEALVRSTNATVLIAEERFIVGWGCCHFAALVNIA